MNKKFALLLASFGLAAAVQADPYVVDAKDNSSSGGIGLDTISLLAGQSFSVMVNAGDLWSAGAIPRWSDANGLTQNFYASGNDESGQTAGTLIGQSFGTFGAFAYGALVGQIGNGAYFLVGTNYTGVASSAGVLKLFYWDSNNSDNTDHITANVSLVPEPETLALMLAGLGMLGLTSRRRRLKG